MTSEQSDGEALASLVDLSHTLADPPRAYAILGEGNVSSRTDKATFLIKASGASLGAATPHSFVRVDLGRAQDLVDRPPTGDEAIDLALRNMVVDSSAGTRPSVETGMHAALFTTTAARWIAHTHAPAITGVLCSVRAEALTAGALFPDQVVVCGAHPLLVPYVDPGVPLARSLMAAVQKHTQTHGEPPKAIYLQNHGFVALGGSAREVLAITDMASKAAAILTVALSCGGVRYLAPEDVARIAGRPDEHHRQRVLGLRGGRST